MGPYVPMLMPELQKSLVDPLPEVRAVSARAIGSLMKGMGQEVFGALVPWLLETLASEGSSVERSGAAQVGGAGGAGGSREGEGEGGGWGGERQVVVGGAGREALCVGMCGRGPAIGPSMCARGERGTGRRENASKG